MTTSRGPLMTDVLTEAKDKQDITEVVFAYGYALDSRDWDRLRSCFTPTWSATTAATRSSGTRRSSRCAARRGAVVGQPAPDRQRGRRGRPGDEAASVCYLHAQHVRPGTEGGEQFIFAGRYTRRLVRTADGWRIAERTLEAMWTAGNAAVIARPMQTLDGNAQSTSGQSTHHG